MTPDIYDINLNYPDWQDDIDAITGEMRGELLAWALQDGFDELVSEPVACNRDENSRDMSNEQSWRRDGAEWLMNLFGDNRPTDKWIEQTRAMYWNYGKRWIQEELLKLDADYELQMSRPCDITVFKEWRDANGR